MSEPSGLESRKLALDILCDNSRRFAREVIDDKLSHSNLSSPDRRMVTEVVNGVIKHAATLKHIVFRYSHRHPCDRVVANTLMIGLYQLLFMNVPAYAAVDTSVRLLKQNNARAARYANALLRKIDNSVRRRETKEESISLLPVQKGVAWEFSQPVFVDPGKDPCSYRAMVYSYPRELVHSWLDSFGKEISLRLLENGNMSPPVFLRIRSGLNRDVLTERLGSEFSHYGDLIQAPRCGSIALLPGFAEKHWVVAGPAAVEVVNALAPNPGDRVLDLCAAPGGKTLHIADLMGDRGEIVACDASLKRLKSLDRVICETKLSSVNTLAVDGGKLPEKYRNYFDRVLVDAPCSNTAVLAKRPEARWRFDKKNLQRLRKIQARLLASGARALKSRGILVYSTCSLEPEENREVIDEFLRDHSDFECFERQILPLEPTLDGSTFFKLARR